jgi:transcriptional regulator with XRE-family HTH domain
VAIVCTTRFSAFVDDDDLELAKRMGVAVRAARRARQLTQAQLAQRIGIAPNYLALLERGERAASLTLVSRIGRTLGVDVTELFGDPPLGDEEEELVLALFRSMTDEMKAHALDVLRVFGVEPSRRPREGRAVPARAPRGRPRRRSGTKKR